tara:strand:- start:920 stop:1375 length:456 start_codon:yes stop_codon:yes gene_type:complete
MKFIYSIISILILAVTVLATDHHMKHPMQEQLAQTQVPVDPTTPQFHQFQVVQPQSSPSINELPNQLVDMFMGQGIVGAMLLVLGVYFYKTESLARTDRINLQAKLESLVERSQDNLVEVKTHLSSLDARMQNVEREIESTKDFILTKLKG